MLPEVSMRMRTSFAAAADGSAADAIRVKATNKVISRGIMGFIGLPQSVCFTIDQANESRAAQAFLPSASIRRVSAVGF
jgi:hypothetical protein